MKTLLFLFAAGLLASGCAADVTVNGRRFAGPRIPAPVLYIPAPRLPGFTMAPIVAGGPRVPVPIVPVLGGYAVITPPSGFEIRAGINYFKTRAATNRGTTGCQWSTQRCLEEVACVGHGGPCVWPVAPGVMRGLPNIRY